MLVFLYLLNNPQVSKPYDFKIYEHSERLSGGCGNYTNRTIGETKTDTNIWILKPADLSRGRGIYLFNQLEDLIYLSKSVVQKYITNPLLIEGYKFDLRLYAVVPSYAPFIVYICADGLVRFATERYDLDDLKNVYSHLTNSSINVNGPGYLINKVSKPYDFKIYEHSERLSGGCGNYTNRTIGETKTDTNIWILKPADLSRGRGIYLFNQLEDLIYLSKSVVQKYITNPLLIEGYKFDLRLYAVVPSYAPFIVYICADGLVRFATERYDLDDLKNVPNAYELFGFDILVDSHLRPWLIEVNANPSLSNDCIVDELVKKPLIKSILEMLRLDQPTLICSGKHTACFTHLRNSTQLHLKSTPITHPVGDHQLFQHSTSNKHSETDNKQATLDDVSASELTLGQPTSCPLYGPGVELLLPQLCALGRRFANLLEPSGKRFQRDNSSSTQSWHTDYTKSASATYPSAYFHVTSQRELVPEEYKAGNQLIPHTFGQLKLAFPFNLITRIACAREPGGYPDQNTIVRQVNQLVQHCAQNVKDNCLHKDPIVMDIPEVWSDKTTNHVET
ncbi:hypothetical protein AHF37_06145 [Paragonimus kellicotti]|nr:hypothetical protein AHF37_06145 [Paragonimus kellicotti]